MMETKTALVVVAVVTTVVAKTADAGCVKRTLLFACVTRKMHPKRKKEVYTRCLPLTSCQEDRLDLDYTVLCHC